MKHLKKFEAFFESLAIDKYGNLASESEDEGTFVIMGQYKDKKPEVLSHADDLENAEILVGEYKMAHGRDWKIWYELEGTVAEDEMEDEIQDEE